MILPIDEILCGDNVAIMSGWPDECIDLSIGSPPYDLVDYDDQGNLVTHSDKGLREYRGYSWDFTAVAQELYRVTKQGGVVVWVVNDATVNGSETGSSFRQALYFMSVGFNLHDTMVYQTDKQPLNGKRYEPKFEFMFVLTRGQPKTWNPIKERSTYAGSKCSPKELNRDGSKKEWSGNGIVKSYKVLGNIWYIPSGKGKTTTDDIDHPGMFPEELARRHIVTWTNPGDLVLDPFAGGGTTAKMCVLADRHYIGIDISQSYVNDARERVAAVKQQPKLFSWDLRPLANGS